MYGYVITKADPTNQEYVGRSFGGLSKDHVLNHKYKSEFICLSIGEVGFIKGFYFNEDPQETMCNVDFEPLDYFQDEVGFTSQFYKTRKGKWQEL